MKQRNTIIFDLYQIYDRLLEGCEAAIDIEYDIDAMVKLNKHNVTIVNIYLTEDTENYVTSQPFNKQEILDAIAKYFKDEDTLLEEFGEIIPDKEWNKIEHILVPQTTNTANSTPATEFKLTSVNTILFNQK